MSLTGRQKHGLYYGHLYGIVGPCYALRYLVRRYAGQFDETSAAAIAAADVIDSVVAFEQAHDIGGVFVAERFVNEKFERLYESTKKLHCLIGSQFDTYSRSDRENFKRNIRKLAQIISDSVYETVDAAMKNPPPPPCEEWAEIPLSADRSDGRVYQVLYGHLVPCFLMKRLVTDYVNKFGAGTKTRAAGAEYLRQLDIFTERPSAARYEAGLARAGLLFAPFVRRRQDEVEKTVGEFRFNLAFLFKLLRETIDILAYSSQ